MLVGYLNTRYGALSIDSSSLQWKSDVDEVVALANDFVDMKVSDKDGNPVVALMRRAQKLMGGELLIVDRPDPPAAPAVEPVVTVDDGPDYGARLDALVERKDPDGIDPIMQLLNKSFDPSQPRDSHGRWVRDMHAYQWALEKFQDPQKAANFATWFDGSQVVDDNGDPKLMYHGTTQDFTQFSLDRARGNTLSEMVGVPMFFMTDNPDMAGSYATGDGGNIKPLYVSIKRPLVIDAQGKEWHETLSDASDRLRPYRSENERMLNNIRMQIEEATGGADSEFESEVPADLQAAFDALYPAVEQEMRAGLLSQPILGITGYDGIIIKNSFDWTAAFQDTPEDYDWSDIPSISPVGDVVIAFSPNQIKSAVANNNYDENDADITKGFNPAQPRDSHGRWVQNMGLYDWALSRYRDPKVAANFANWFDGSQMVDAAGKPLVLYHGTNRSFTEFDDGRQRDARLQQFQGAGFFFTANPSTADRYAGAAANESFDRTTMEAALHQKYPGFVADLYTNIMDHGYSTGWEKTSEAYGVQDKPYTEWPLPPGFDINDINVLTEATEGYREEGDAEIEPGDIAAAIFGGGRPSYFEHARELAEKLGLPVPSNNVMPVFLRATNVLRTSSREEAKQAQANGYDGVIYFSDDDDDLIDGEPEFVVFDKRQVKSATGNMKFDAMNPDITKSVLKACRGLLKAFGNQGDEEQPEQPQQQPAQGQPAQGGQPSGNSGQFEESKFRRDQSGRFSSNGGGGGGGAAQAGQAFQAVGGPQKLAGPTPSDIAAKKAGRLMVEQGNIDLNNRPIVKNPDGSISTVRSISIEQDGKVYLIPTVSPDGKVVPDEKAIELFNKTGKHLGVFKNERGAQIYAIELHRAQARQYAKQRSVQKSMQQFMIGSRYSEALRKSAGITHAGLAIVAEDTGRALMLQRAIEEGDPAKGKIEFPGGGIEQGEDPYNAACREWTEEVGQNLPEGLKLVDTWDSGCYRGHIATVPSEADIDINTDREVINPDDPDGDVTEVVLWFYPDDIEGNPACRQELVDSFSDVRPKMPTVDLIKAAGALFAMSMNKARAPKGFTEDKPLMINGMGYVGGQYIPGVPQADVNAEAAKQMEGAVPIGNKSPIAQNVPGYDPTPYQRRSNQTAPDGRTIYDMSAEEYINTVNPDGKWHQDDFMDRHGGVDLSHNKKEDYPVLVRVDANGIEYRRSATKNKYTTRDADGEIARDADGNLIYMTDDQIKAEGLPVFDQAIYAFDGDKAVGYVGDSFGAIEMYIPQDQRGRGIGANLSHIARSDEPFWPSGGQSNGGEALAEQTYWTIVNGGVPKRLAELRLEVQQLRNEVSKRYQEKVASLPTGEGYDAEAIKLKDAKDAAFEEMREWEIANISPRMDAAEEEIKRIRAMKPSEAKAAYPDIVKARAPRGFTMQRPLMINGVAYIGGRYIPDATQEEVDRAAQDQSQYQVSIVQSDLNNNGLYKEIAQSFPEGPRREQALNAANSGKWFNTLVMRDKSGSMLGIASLWSDPDSASRTDLEAMPDEKYIRIGSMATAAPGIGRDLFDSVLQYADDKEAGIYLSSLEGSVGFYEKLGVRNGLGATYFLTHDEVKQRLSGDGDKADYIRDDNGKPITFYHGTLEDFASFSDDRLSDGSLGRGHYFTTTENQALMYGKIHNIKRKREGLPELPITVKPVHLRASRVFEPTLLVGQGAMDNTKVREDGYDAIKYKNEMLVFNADQIDPANINKEFNPLQPRGRDGRWIDSFMLDAAANDMDLLTYLMTQAADRKEQFKIGDWVRKIGAKNSDIAIAMRNSDATREKMRHSESPQFRSWFGSSVVVDENGQPKETYKLPIKVFHGTNEQFEAFDKNLQNIGYVGAGFYFAEDKRIADHFANDNDTGNIVEAYLSVSNPIKLWEKPRPEDIEAMIDYYKSDQGMADIKSRLVDIAAHRFKDSEDDRQAHQEELLGLAESKRNFLISTIDEVGKAKDGRWSDIYDTIRDQGTFADLNLCMQAIGFDGITHYTDDLWGSSHRGDCGIHGRCWIVFKPTQIKSVDNEGTFDPSNPNIYKAHAPKGFSKERPLTINGKQYTGGQFIPNVSQEEVDAEATKQSRPQQATQADKQAAPVKATFDQWAAKTKEWEQATGLDSNTYDIPFGDYQEQIDWMDKFMKEHQAKGDAQGWEPEDKSGINHPDYQSLRKLFIGSLKSVDIPVKKKKEFAEQMQMALQAMSPEAVTSARHGIEGVQWHKDEIALTRATGRADKLAEGKVIVGCYVFNEQGNMGELNLDGGGADVYVHELAHAADWTTTGDQRASGQGGRISDTDEWKQAFESELKNGSISDYGATSPIEGFAEFARTVWGYPEHHEKLKQSHPKCWSIFEKYKFD